MPRTKGSKNKITLPAVDTAAIEEKMKELEGELAELGAAAKAKKNELKALAKSKLAAEKAEAAKKAEEGKKAVMDAFEKSGKTVEEILEFLKK